MIAYEQLCEALQRYNSRRQNAAEMARLEQDVSAEVPPPGTAPYAGRTAEQLALGGASGQGDDEEATVTGAPPVPEQGQDDYHQVDDDQIDESVLEEGEGRHFD